MWFPCKSVVQKRRLGYPCSGSARLTAAQKPWIVPIPGATKLTHLDENLGAAAIELTSDDLREIESAAAKIEVRGHRIPKRWSD